ncbi:MAG: helix-turn-helix transcriptional regulator [Saprospirales bacterium]|nr:helix-turn-helix transcriptional regulator [Saprospirales bacterium]
MALKLFFLPAPALRPFVSHYDIIAPEGEFPSGFIPPQLSSGFSFCKFQTSGFQTANEKQSQKSIPASFIIPVHTQSFTVDLSGPSWAFGVHFYPGKFHDFFGWPQDLFTEEQEAVRPDETDFRKDFLELEEQIHEAKTPAEQAAWTDSFLLRHYPRHPVLSPAIDQALSFVREAGGAIHLSELLERSCLSERHFRRRFKEHTGLQAHTYLRIYRFYQAFWRLPSGRYPSLTDLAHEVGYFDQAHFIRDFKFFTGQTPREFLQQHASVTEQFAWDVESEEFAAP